MTEPVTPTQAKQIAELEVRRYFDHYLEDVLPLQQKAQRELMHLMMEKHDSSQESHGGVEHRLNKLIWITVGVASAAGGVGAALTKVFGG